MKVIILIGCIMGNTVTVANLAAAQIVHPETSVASDTTKYNQTSTYAHPPYHPSIHGEPPPECPMHRSRTQVWREREREKA